MVGKEAVERIINWFDSAELCSLSLPDGWFGGRPYENLHRLTFVDVRPHFLLLELDSQLLLTFSDITSVRVESSELVFSEFKQLVFDWLEYVNLRPHTDVYLHGVVKLVPPIGTVIR